jgi:hypothetical protein
MALSPELENRIVDLRAGITAAPVSEVGNERAHLLQVIGAIESLKGSKALSADHEAAIAEVRAVCAAGASVVMNKRATLLVLFSCIDSLRSDKPAKTEAPKS